MPLPRNTPPGLQQGPQAFQAVRRRRESSTIRPGARPPLQDDRTCASDLPAQVSQCGPYSNQTRHCPACGVRGEASSGLHQACVAGYPPNRNKEPLRQCHRRERVCQLAPFYRSRARLCRQSRGSQQASVAVEHGSGLPLSGDLRLLPNRLSLELRFQPGAQCSSPMCSTRFRGQPPWRCLAMHAIH